MPVPVAAPPAVVFEDVTIGVSAEVDVEHRALRALEQHVLTARVERLERLRDVGDQRLDALGLGEAVLEHLLEVDRRLLEIALQHEIVEIEYFAQLRGEPLALEQIRHAHCAPRHLVLVGRTDAAPRGADGIRATRALARLVEGDMRGQDQRARRADPQPLEHRHAARDEAIGLFEQRRERQHHAVADEALHVRVQNSRWNERQDRTARSPMTSV